MEHTTEGFPEPGELYLQPTKYFDFDTPIVRDFANEAVEGARDDVEKAVRIYYAVRDRVRYDPYFMSDDPDEYRASFVLTAGSGFCVQKAVLMVACTRAVGIPTGIGFSNVTNHLCSERLLNIMAGKTLFIHHGYAVMYLNGKWVKAAPAFNIELCDRFHVEPTEFDGTANALFQEFDKKGRRHMEYESDHGIWSDYPHERIIADFQDYYPETIYEDCARERQRNADKLARNFEDEIPLS
jgi:transglutaminase-like putative cysteine protease